ncbi:hypothetical protein JZ751_001070 [Albula glossodonta]|uniref:XRCC4 N-terminal domain-containing protein n=1 Tax=Albula glossodonta TaxID=121402 RepID=A0A8T2PSM5_9TELE|nr:hypothetical protein JZ751_001070 [Albula glossodonta]
MNDIGQLRYACLFPQVSHLIRQGQGMSVSVTQITVSYESESDGTFFLKVDWVEDLGAGFTVALCDGESAWMGEVSEEEVTREAEDLEMRRERYVEELQLALAGGAGRPNGAYAFQLSSESARRGRARRLTYEKVQKDILVSFGFPQCTAVGVGSGEMKGGSLWPCVSSEEGV